MKKTFKLWPFLFVIFLAFLVRFISLDKVPSALYYDEIDLGFQIRSLLQTGKDYRGNASPFYFRSFNTDKTPLPILFSTIPSLFFNSPEFQVRAGTALAGVLVVILAMVITFQLTKSMVASFLAGMVFALSPWQVHFSRMAFEAEHLLLFLFLFIALFFQWLSTRSIKYLYLSALTLGLSVYTYRTMSLLAPVILILTPLIFKKNFLEAGLKKTCIWFIISSVLIIPFLYVTTFGSKDQPRISQISIFSDKLIPIEVQRSRELVSGNFQNPTLGQSPTLWSKIFHNKVVSIFERLKDNTLKNFSTEFLFLEGDPNGRHSAKSTGELLFLDIVALVAGSFFVFQNLKDKRFVFLSLLLFLGALPANLTLDGANHASRLISFSGPLLLIVSLGYFWIVKTLSTTKVKYLLLVPLALLWIFSSMQFINKYFYHFPIINAREFGYGYKQAIEKINSVGKDYKHIDLTETNDPPILYYLFWANISPKEVQEYGSEFNAESFRSLPLDKVRPFSPEDHLCSEKQILSLRPDTLYMVAFKNISLDFRAPDKDLVPQGIKLLDVIKYPNNEPAYYLLTRDSKDGKSINPLKTQKCK